jgi:RNA binding exosome subunit
MKYFHSIKLTVFSKPEDDEEKIKTAFLGLIPFDFEKEKVECKLQTASGFTERKIKIFEIKLLKQRHTDAFFDFLMSKLNDEQKKLLLRQKESRLDDNLNFFIRLDKEKLFENEYFITDSGSCFHIMISIAAFPAKKECGLRIIDEIFLKQGIN